MVKFTENHHLRGITTRGGEIAFSPGTPVLFTRIWSHSERTGPFTVLPMHTYATVSSALVHAGWLADRSLTPHAPRSRLAYIIQVSRQSL